MRKPQGVDSRVDARVRVDEYAETQVLLPQPAKLPPGDDDANAQSVYSEYVQDLERLLRADAQKK